MNGQNYTQNQQGVHVDQPLKNILIPDSNTFYQLSLFLWNPTYDAGAGTITFSVQWTAPFGGVQTMSVTLDLATAPAKQSNAEGIWVLAGTPIQYSVIGGGTYGAATYSYLLALADLSQGSSCGSPIVPIPLQMPDNRYSCPPAPCSPQQQPLIVFPQQPCPPQPYPRPVPYRRYLIEDDEDAPYNGPWGCDNDC